jgi:hypothetical protein
LNKIGSKKNLRESQQVDISDVDADVSEHDDNSLLSKRKNSPGKVLKNYGAESVYEKEITVQ